MSTFMQFHKNKCSGQNKYIKTWKNELDKQKER